MGMSADRGEDRSAARTGAEGGGAAEGMSADRGEDRSAARTGAEGGGAAEGMSADRGEDRSAARTGAEGGGAAEGMSADHRVRVWLHAVGMEICALAGFAVVVGYAIRSVRGFNFDQRMMNSLGVSSGGWSRIAGVFELVTDAGVAIALLACVIAAVVQRRWAVAVSAGVLVAGANLTTRFLKYHFLHSVMHGNTLPSGH